MAQVDFMQLTARLNYPPTVKSKLSDVHATLMDQFFSIYTGKYVERKQVIHAFNCITLMYISKDSFPDTWKASDPFNTFRDFDEDVLQEKLGQLYVSTKDIDWTNVVAQSSEDAVTVADSSSDAPVVAASNTEPAPIPKFTYIPEGKTIEPTDKSDLYIQPPVVPRFDVTKPIVTGVVDECAYTIYTSFPIVPTKQNEISATTDVNKMSSNDLIRLFPNCNIHTRAACMYEPCDKIELDPVLGLILPIKGFSRKQLIENLIKYPHLFKLQKEVDGQLESFYTTLEVNEELHKISEYWSELPESKVIPYTKEFVKEYVVRRYLLERDIKGIKHRYKMYGSLDPFLTLFTTPEGYTTLGYKDSIKLAYDCVSARVSYKKSRNPVLRRLANV